MSLLFDFVDYDAESVEIPAGGEGGGLSERGFIAPIRMGFFYSNQSFWTPLDLRETSIEGGDEFNIPFSRQSRQGSYQFYWPDKSQAVVGMKLIAEEYTKRTGEQVRSAEPKFVWVARTEPEAVVNLTEEQKSKFQDTIHYEVQVLTLGSRLTRHKWHLVTMPGLVQALARLQGVIHENYFDPSDLIRARIEMQTGKRIVRKDGEDQEIPITDPEIFTPEFFTEQFGDPDRDADLGVWVNSKMGQQRASLWKALGEDNPFATTVDQKSKLHAITPGTELFDIVRALLQPWRKPIWARLTGMPDPHPEKGGYTDNDGNFRRNNFPMVPEFFASEEDARIAAEKDLGKSESNPSSNGTTGAVARPPLPSSWQAIPGRDEDAKAQQLLETLETYQNRDLDETAEQMQMSTEEIATWRNYAQATGS